MRFKEYINEKLEPSLFRKYVKRWKESGVRARYDSIFGKKDRLYEPYDGNVPKHAEANDSRVAELQIENIFRDAPHVDYILLDYDKGLAKNRETGRDIKVTKALNSLINYYKKKAEENKSHAYFYHNYTTEVERIETALKNFINDKTRALKKKNKEYLICYSRHAYDIAGMSTDRGWTSCQNLKNGSMVGYVTLDIKEGTIVAYLINADDKNIQHPISRVLLKPYFNKNNDSILMAAQCYGTEIDDFNRQVQKWADENFNKGKYGRFTISQKVYKEGEEEIDIAIPKEEAQKKFKYVIYTGEDLVNFLIHHIDRREELYDIQGRFEVSKDLYVNTDTIGFTTEQLLRLWKDCPLALLGVKNLFIFVVGDYIFTQTTKREAKGVYKWLIHFVYEKMRYNRIQNREEFDREMAQSSYKDWEDYLSPGFHNTLWNYYKELAKI